MQDLTPLPAPSARGDERWNARLRVEERAPLADKTAALDFDQADFGDSVEARGGARGLEVEEDERAVEHHATRLTGASCRASASSRLIMRSMTWIDDLFSFYQVKLSVKERQRLDAQELQKAQEALWRKIRTTNLIERAFREVRRRTKPMGVFGNRNSMERILYAVFFHLNSKGQEGTSWPFTQNA